jgi:hypothetical protein
MKVAIFGLNSPRLRMLAARNGALLSAAVACALAAPAHAQVPTAFAYSNTPLSKTSVFLKGTTPTVIKQVTLDLKAPSNVLVQFTSGVAAETSKGCPCSIRASVSIDDKETRVVKRINVAAPAVQEVNKYEHDRQNLDGSTVYELGAGRHTVTLSYQQVTGTSEELEVYYPNLQVIGFPK